MFEGQTLRIGDGITVYMERARNGKVRVAVRAPRELRIDRLDSSGNVIAPDKGRILQVDGNGR
jgi:sRNA-binding carbon storage regulator CsrA